MRENEALLTIERYFGKENGTELHYLGANDGVNFFLDVFQNGTIYYGDAPDMVVFKDNTAIIIEHFEFDCYRVLKKKGSTSRFEEARIERAQQKIQATKDGILYQDCIKAENSYTDYIANVTRSFSVHYNHIGNYKMNLINKNLITTGMQVKTLFLIEDTSPVGTMVFNKSYEGEPLTPVFLAYSPEFLELFENSPDLDYVLACSSMGTQEFVWFIDRNQIDSYKEKSCDYDSMFLLPSTPAVLIAKKIVPNTCDESKMSDIK